jgi:putative oxidoreductase
MKKETIAEICSGLIVLLFLYASLSKFTDFATFIREMHNQPFPRWVTDIFIWTIPFLEIIIASALLYWKTRLIGFISAFALMSLFTLYASLVLLNAFKYVPCSCGGIIKLLKWPAHLVLNIVYTGIAATGWINQRKTNTLKLITPEMA